MAANKNKLRQINTSRGLFNSVAEAARFFSIPEHNIRARLKLGWSHDEAVGLLQRPPQKSPNGNPVECEGKRYDSHGKLADAYGLKRTLVGKRLRNGWTVEQAVNLIDPPPRYRNNDGTKRQHSWVNPVTLKSGQLAADSLTGRYLLYLIKNKINSKLYVGITTSSLQTRFYHHISSAKKSSGQTKLHNAIKAYGEDNFFIELLRDDANSIDELLLQESKAIKGLNCIKKGYNTADGGAFGTSKPIVVEGKTFESRYLAAAYYDVDSSVFNLRLGRLGWTPEEAAGLVSREFQRHKIEVQYNGEILYFASLSLAAKHFSLSYKTVHARFRNGWTVDEALEIVPLSEDRANARGISIFYSGVRFVSFQSLARELDISYHSLYYYIKKHNLSTEDAVFVVKNSLQRQLKTICRLDSLEACDAVAKLKEDFREEYITENLS